MDGDDPSVIFWFKVYSLALAGVYLLCTAGSIAMMLVDPATLDMGRTEQLIFGGLLGAIGAVLFVPFAAAPFLPRRPWVYVLDIVLIAIGMTSPCCVLASLPLLIFWIRPDTRAAFGRR